MRCIRFELSHDERTVSACVARIDPDSTIVIEDLAVDLPLDDLGARIVRYIHEVQRKYGALVYIVPADDNAPPSTWQPTTIMPGGLGAGKSWRMAHMIADKLLRRRRR